MLDLFARQHEDARLHPHFRNLRDGPFGAPARAMLTKVCEDLDDPDGNLVEQFQTFGFDARTFEIFLFAMFKEEGHAIDRNHDRPDFGLTRHGFRAWVEAVTANPAPDGTIRPYRILQHDGATFDYLDEIPIRLGSPLFSKLKKRYWELPHVAGAPLVFAIQDFHTAGSLTNSSSALTNYLFGIGSAWFHDQDGRLVISHTAVSDHRHGLKRIPSGFFAQPGAENVSAVLFSNTGTVPKFGRMGHQGPYRALDLRMLRYGTIYRHDPNATLPAAFLYEVGDPDYGLESWREGTVLIRNPNARHPLPRGWLGAAAEEDRVGDQVVTTFLEPFLPYMSITENFHGADDAFVRRRAEEVKATLLETFPP